MPQDSTRWFTYLFETFWLTASKRSGIKPQDRRNRGTSGVPKGNFFQFVANIWPDGEPPGNPGWVSQIHFLRNVTNANPEPDRAVGLDGEPTGNLNPIWPNFGPVAC
jgi:hypothetical protein